MCVKWLYTLDPSPTFLEMCGASKYAIEEDFERRGLLGGCQPHQGVIILVVPLEDVMELDVVELVHHLLDLHVVGLHIHITTSRLLHDFVDN